jgi:hypothetical protein
VITVGSHAEPPTPQELSNPHPTLASLEQPVLQPLIATVQPTQDTTSEHPAQFEMAIEQPRHEAATEHCAHETKIEHC